MVATSLASPWTATGTPLSAVEEILGDVDLVLLMSVNPGFGGQRYIEGTTGKVARLRSMMESRGVKAHIQVDGGLSAANVRAVVRAGADALVVGQSVYGASDPAAAVREIRAAASRDR